MSIRQTIMILGFFLIIQPFLGFTSDMDMIINVVIGLLIIILAYKIFPVDSDAASSNNLENNFGKKKDLPFEEHKSTNINNNSVS